VDSVRGSYTCLGGNGVRPNSTQGLCVLRSTDVFLGWFLMRSSDVWLVSLVHFFLWAHGSMVASMQPSDQILIEPMPRMCSPCVSLHVCEPELVWAQLVFGRTRVSSVRAHFWSATLLIPNIQQNSWRIISLIKNEHVSCHELHFILWWSIIKITTANTATGAVKTSSSKFSCSIKLLFKLWLARGELISFQ
jgi:hypothetical protein